MNFKVFVTCFFSMCGFCDIIDLSKFENSIYSQNGEDGVLAKIFQVLEVANGYCVEFGAYDGYVFSNTLQFRNKGWSALLLDGDFEDPSINLHKEWINRESIVDIFSKYNVPSEFDLLSIDIDSNDWYIWNELAEIYRPKVIVIEYNPSYGPDVDMIIPYDPLRTWDGLSNYSGASYLAYFKLGRKFNYSLVYSTALNSFFIRDDIILNKRLHFKNVNDVHGMYRGPSSCAENLRALPHTSTQVIFDEESHSSSQPNSRK